MTTRKAALGDLYADAERWRTVSGVLSVGANVMPLARVEPLIMSAPAVSVGAFDAYEGVVDAVEGLLSEGTAELLGVSRGLSVVAEVYRGQDQVAVDRLSGLWSPDVS
ncbi:MAG: hypothetical protein LWW86_15950 [Micrococcales bacterium]|nr:hypothetical protein [Micrococcales bacterium]